MSNQLHSEGGVAWGVSNGIGRLELRRPERANALSRTLSLALAHAIGEVLDSAPRVILLTAQGRIFCAGGDIDEFAAAGTALDALVDETLMPLHPALHRLVMAPIPLVAALNGPVGGAGIGLALCADFVLAAASMKLRTGYASIGLSPDMGTAYFLARRVGPIRAQQWLMLSDAIGAQECLAAGAVDTLHPDTELSAAAEALAARLAQASSASLASIKTLCTGLPVRELMAHLDLEHRLMAECARSADAREGVRAFMERQPPCFSGRSPKKMHDQSAYAGPES